MNTVEKGLVSLADKGGQKSPVLASATLVLIIPDGAGSVTVRADSASGPATVARYSLASISAGAQSAGDGSRLFSLASDIQIPVTGLEMLYLAVDTGTANWQFAFVTA